MDHRRRIRSHRARAASRAIPLTVGCSPPECRVAARLRVALRASLSRGSAAAPPQAHADDRGPARVPRGEREAPRVSPRHRVPRVLTILARSRRRLLRSAPRGGGARRPPSWRIAGSVKDASKCSKQGLAMLHQAQPASEQPVAPLGGGGFSLWNLAAQQTTEETTYRAPPGHIDDRKPPLCLDFLL